jgi:hypothetical protein
MFSVLKGNGRPLLSFKKGDIIHVWNRMEKNYSYELSENPFTNFADGFEPYLSPGDILALGAFGGKYLNDCLLEFPAEWFWRAGLLGKLCPGEQDINVNHFKIDSRLSLSEWRKAGWIPSKGVPSTVGKGKRAVLSSEKTNPDERGWFQWYCRYWLGRRIPDLDAVQIQRWKNFRRHYGAVQKACEGDIECRPRQRQALLHWAWAFND